MIDLNTSALEVFKHAMEGDRSNNQRSNFQEAIAVLQFQVLIQQEKTAKAQRFAAIATFLLFLATLGLVIVTAA